MPSNSSPPDNVKRSIRAALLARFRTDTLDTYELDLFDWYLTETEAVLAGMVASERKYIEDQVAGGLEDFNDSGLVAIEYYTKRIRYSHVIYLTSLLETCLERACERLTSVLGTSSIPFELGELSGDQWTKRRRFLERYGRIEFPDEPWSEVEVLISIRNCLVHENGNTSDLSRRSRREYQARVGLSIGGPAIEIDESYVRTAYTAVRTLVQSVEEQLQDIVARARHPRST